MASAVIAASREGTFTFSCVLLGKRVETRHRASLVEMTILFSRR
jgi:hypothetical protein